VSEESPLPADERQLAASEKVTDVRLPRHLVAEKYKLKLIPFIIPGNFTIKGSVEVILEVDEDTLLWMKSYCSIAQRDCCKPSINKDPFLDRLTWPMP
jgi:hypothetical protein